MSCFHRIAFTHWWSGAWKVTRLESLVRSAVPGILFLNYFHALLLGEIRKSCGTRSWSASGGRGTLSYHALDDRRESGVKANAMEAVRFGRIVPALLVSALHLRSAPRAFAGRDQRGDPCVLRSADRNRKTLVHECRAPTHLPELRQ
jgi:hypothetical protein